MDFEELAQRVLDTKLEAVKVVLLDLAKPLAALKNPESLLGKKYDEWSSGDLERMKLIYGAEPNILSEFIMKKEYEKTLAMESEVV